MERGGKGTDRLPSYPEPQSSIKNGRADLSLHFHLRAEPPAPSLAPPPRPGVPAAPRERHLRQVAEGGFHPDEECSASVPGSGGLRAALANIDLRQLPLRFPWELASEEIQGARELGVKWSIRCGKG